MLQSIKQSLSNMTSILDLSSIVFNRIAAYSDRDSLTALTSAHPELQKKLQSSLETLKVDCLTDSVLNYVKVNGSFVRHLDLSGCSSAHDTIGSVILKCRNVTHLDLVNSNFRTFGALKHSNKVEKLSLSAIDGVYFILPSNHHSLDEHTELMMCCSVAPFVVKEKLPFESLKSSSLTSVKEIFIETVFREQQLVFTMCILNLCHNAHTIHLNIYGRARTDPEKDVRLPALAAYRWKTLNTVVVTRHLSKKRSAEAIMRALFAHHPDPAIHQWIDHDQECYIYEHGQFNGNTCPSESVYRDTKFLRYYHQVELSPDGNSTGIFASPWGPARSVRISGELLSASPYLQNSLSTTLTELDVTKCHGNFSNKFRVDLITSVPALEVLACSLCVFSRIDLNVYNKRNTSRNHFEDFEKALHRLKLRKLYLRGSLHTLTCSTSRCSPCLQGLDCPEKCVREPLTSSDVVNLNKLNHLEELTIRDVDLGTSSFSNLGNPGLRTLKLCLSSNICDTGLKNLIHQSRDLEFIKLEAPELVLYSSGLWEALNEARKLRQLCLRTEQIYYERIYREPRFDEFYRPVHERVEFMHLHCHFRVIDLVDSWQSSRKIKHYSASPQDEWSRLRPGLIGRGLCFAESSVGVVPPLGGWGAD